MATLYVLAHFDDEFCGLPLIWRDRAEGRTQRFVYVVDYRSEALSARRLSETRDFLAAQGLPPDGVTHLGAGTGWIDGQLYRHAPAAYAALRAHADFPIDRIVCPAWEGGHPDHDVCAAMAVKLAAELGGVPVETLSLYQGKGLPWILYRAASPLPENGPARSLRLSLRDWLRWVVSVRAFPSQLKAWSGLLPGMIWTFLQQGEFRYQSLDPQRIGQRPHAGKLLYEAMFNVPYEEVRAAADALAEDGRAPWSRP